MSDFTDIGESGYLIPGGVIIQPTDSQVTPAPVPLTEGERTEPLMRAWDAVYRYWMSLPNVNPDVFIAHRGYDELDKMLTMAAYSTPLRILFYAILFKGANLLPAVESAKTEQKNGFQKGDYDRAMQQLESTHYHLHNIRDDKTGQATDLKTVLYKMLWAVHHGFSVQETHWKDVLYGPFKGEWGLSGTTYHRCKSTGFDVDPNTLGILNVRNWPLDAPDKKTMGRQIPLEKVLYYGFEPTNNLPHGNGVARKLYKHYLLLDRALRDWAIQTKRAGGFIEAICNNAGDEAEAATLIQTVENGGSLAHTRDKFTIEMHPGLAGSMDFIGLFADYNAGVMTETILGTQMTTKESGKSSYAKSKVGENTQSFVLSGPRGNLEFEFTAQTIHWLNVYNYGHERAHLAPRLSLGNWDEEMLLLQAQIITEYVKMGILHPQYDNAQIRRYAHLWAFDETQKEAIPLPLLPDRERVNVQEGPDGPVDPTKGQSNAG